MILTRFSSHFSNWIRRFCAIGIIACSPYLLAMPEQLSFNHLSSSDGLPQNTITTMLQDRNGFIWIGTHGGLHKYDGYHWVSYKNDARSSTSISSNVITALVEDKQGMLWIATAQGGLNKLDPSTGVFKQYQASANNFDSISHNSISALYIDPQQALWIGTYNGLNLYNPESDTFSHFYHNPLDNQSIPNGSVTAVTGDGQGNLFVATTEMLSRYDISQQTFLRFDGFDAPTRINCLFLDEDKSLWVGTQLEGLYHLTPSSKDFDQFINNHLEPETISSNNVRTIMRDTRGNLWIGTEQGGLNLKPKASRVFQHFLKNAADMHSLSINDVWSLMEDASGQIWIGTAGGGINKTTPHFQNFSRLQHSPFNTESLSHNFVWNIKQDKQQSIWFATLNGIDRFHPASGKFDHFNLFFDQSGRRLSSRITTLAIDQDGSIWFGNQDGQVGHFQPDQHKTRVQVINRSGFMPGNFSNSRIRMITRDRMNNIWVASDEGLALLESKTGKLIEDFRFAAVGELGTSSIYTLFQDDQGIMWFGTWDSGLQRYDPEFRQTLTFRNRPEQEFSLSDNTVRSIYQDHQGNLWIGTYNGLNLLKQQDRLNGNFKFYSFYESDGLPNNTVYGITSDDSGHLWLSTNKGISRFNPENQRFKNFTSLDGLPADEFNGNAALKSIGGLLYFGSVSGVAVINPSGITPSQFKPKLHITDIRVNNQPSFLQNHWKVIEQIELQPQQNNLTLRFSALDLRLPQRIEYAYRLLPYEKDWKTLLGKNEVHYGNLNSGQYRFEIHSTNSDGIWNDEITTLSVQIHPPLWATWWAYTLYIVTFVGMVSWFIYRHDQKLKEQQNLNEHLKRIDKLKDEFLANTSHELRTPLNGIIGIAESLREGIAGEVNHKTQHHLNLIIDSGKRLAHQVDEILDFKKLRHHGLLLNLSPVDLRVAAKVVIHLLQPLAEEKKLQLTNSLPQFLPPVLADENRLRQILYNLIGNAIKYTESGFVELTARVDNQTIEVCVKDSGVGIPLDKQSIIFKPFEQLDMNGAQIKSGTGLGLAVTQQLIHLHQGRLWLQSRINKGSDFYFTLPIATETRSPVIQPVVSDEHFLAPVAKKHLQEPMLVQDPSDRPHILIVDDDALNRQVLNDFLVIRNYRVTEAIDGLQAIELIQKTTYDLVILDIMMPKMSGFEVCEKVRQNYSPLELPILLLSAKNQPEDIETGLSSGANDYVSKPVDRKVLMARVTTLLMLREVYRSQAERAQLKAMEQTCDQLSRYFPRPLVEKILENDARYEIQPERKCITVLFADMVGFTEFSDRFEPETITDVLNEFISAMSTTVYRHSGLLNEVLGDGLVILFGALEHLDKESQAIKAVELAKEMRSIMLELSEKWRATGLEQQLKLRMGIHQSYVTLGNFGSQEMIVFRAIGSGVNLSARIQSMAQPGEVLVSYPIFAQARTLFEFEEQETIQFKGFNHSHRIFKLTS